MEIELNAPLPTTADEAACELEKIYADKSHPYFERPDHPLRERALQRVEKLFEIKSAGREVVDVLVPLPFPQTTQGAIEQEAYLINAGKEI